MSARSCAWLLGAAVALTAGCRSNDPATRSAPSATAPASSPDTAPGSGAASVAFGSGAASVPAAAPSAAPISASPRPSAPSAPPRPSGAAAPQAVLFLPISAYHASIAMDEEAVYVLTPTAVHRIIVGQSTESFPRELGPGAVMGAVMTEDGFVYWSKGRLYEAPKGRGEPRVIGVLQRPPQRLTAASERLVWIDAAAGRFGIQTLEAGKPRQLYTSSVTIDALALLGDDVFFVERRSAQRWRIGRVRLLQGSDARFTSEKRGRSPAQLVAFGGAVYFQDPSGYQVLELSGDLEHERTRARDLVCSPLAVSEQVYCAQVEGLVEVPSGNRQPRLLAPNTRGLITALAVNSSAIAWLTDAGPDQLTVKWLRRQRP